MITGIRVGHYRQIAARETIELVHPERDGKAAEPACAAGVWGAHGAGKSALIDALEWLHNATVRWAPADWPPIPRSATARPASVGVELVDDGRRYRYSLSAEDGRIVHEKLYAPSDGGDKREEIVFERTAGGLELGEALKLQPEMALLGRIGPTGTVMLGADLLCEPLCASLKCELEAMRFVRPLGRIDEALQTTVDICSKEGAGNSPTGVRRRIAAALLQQAGIRSRRRRARRLHPGRRAHSRRRGGRAPGRGDRRCSRRSSRRRKAAGRGPHRRGRARRLAEDARRLLHEPAEDARTPRATALHRHEQRPHRHDAARPGVVRRAGNARHDRRQPRRLQ